MKKRILSAFLVLCMALLLFPAGALADDEAPDMAEEEAELLSEVVPELDTIQIPEAAAEASEDGTENDAPTSGTCGENLTWSLDVESGVLTISGTGAMADYGDYPSYSPWRSIRENITSIIIESGVTSIGDYAFLNSYNLTSVTIPDSVRAIGEGAFHSCSFTSITIPDGVTSIENETFYRCSDLKSIVLPDSLTSIGVGAFTDCYSLKSIDIPDSVTTIGASAFMCCWSLTSVILPEGVTTIADGLFCDCCSLSEVNFSDRVTSIGCCAFEDCKSLEIFVIPDGVTSIERYTFDGCTGLLSIYIPASVTSIGEEAFQDCHNLKFLFYPGTEEEFARIQIEPISYSFLRKAKFYQFYTESPFEDVVYSEDNWYYEPVLWALNMGITAGTSETTFSPNNFCTRAQAVAFLWRAAGEPEPESTAMPFTDVKSGDYYYDAVLWAVENGITAGTTATTFSPNKSCTRGQIVSFLYRCETAGLESVPALNSDTAFTDLSETAYYYAPVLWAAQEGIVAGITDTTFGPNRYCTRAQIVAFLYRYLVESLYE